MRNLTNIFLHPRRPRSFIAVSKNPYMYVHIYIYTYSTRAHAHTQTPQHTVMQHVRAPSSSPRAYVSISIAIQPYMWGHQKHNPRDPSIQIIPTLGPKVCKYYLHWAIWIPRVISFWVRTRDTKCGRYVVSYQSPSANGGNFAPPKWEPEPHTLSPSGSEHKILFNPTQALIPYPRNHTI